jgi:ribonuclease HII
MKSRARYVIGIDEVGRGALAGPLTVGAVVIPAGFRVPKGRDVPPLRDSKRLSRRQRELWVEKLKKCEDVAFVTARIKSKTIDRLNVSHAANVAAARACERTIALSCAAPSSFNVYLDGGLYLDKRTSPELVKLKAKTIVRGDEKINAIKLASITAKVSRDRYMVRLGRQYPKYGFDIHKGYGTKKHIRAIRRHGPSDVHRLTFLKNYLTMRTNQ